jgi:hypothetical protein
MSMEYRIWMSITNMPLSQESKWLPLMTHLEHHHAELGPVASWDDDTTMVLTIAADEPDRAAAANLAMRVASDALHATSLGEFFPSIFQIEPATDLIAA